MIMMMDHDAKYILMMFLAIAFSTFYLLLLIQSLSSVKSILSGRCAFFSWKYSWKMIWTFSRSLKILLNAWLMTSMDRE